MIKVNSRIKVLIIDDDENHSKGLAEKLNLNGFSAEYVLDGKDGLKRIKMQKDKQFDAVVCDLKMPNMGGDDVFEKILQIAPTICFIILTGYGTIPNAVKLIRMGTYGYFKKPILKEQFDEFLLTIKRGVTEKKIRMIEEKVLSTFDFDKIFEYLIDTAEIIFSMREYRLAIIENYGTETLKIKKHKGFKEIPILKKHGFIKAVFDEKRPLLVKSVGDNQKWPETNKVGPIFN